MQLVILVQFGGLSTLRAPVKPLLLIDFLVPGCTQFSVQLGASKSINSKRWASVHIMEHATPVQQDIFTNASNISFYFTCFLFQHGI